MRATQELELLRHYMTMENRLKEYREILQYMQCRIYTTKREKNKQKQDVAHFNARIQAVENELILFIELLDRLSINRFTHS